MRPAATDGVLSPPPRPLTFQARGGPSFGHSLSKPVSLEWAVRSGPCHCGQSNGPHKPRWVKAATARASAMVRYIRFNHKPNEKVSSLAERANLLAKHAKSFRPKSPL